MSTVLSANACVARSFDITETEGKVIREINAITSNDIPCRQLSILNIREVEEVSCNVRL